MDIVIQQHRIVGAPFKASPNHGAAFASGMPDAIIMHFTGGSSAASAINWLCDPQAKASAHVVIGRDGIITQLVPFDTVAWHAGASSHGGRSGYNKLSIGIELDNPGRLKRTEGGGYVSAFGKQYPPDQVIAAVHRNERSESFWLAYTEEQISAAFALCGALCASYPVWEILGHEEIAPGRKDDPGPAFPLDRLRQRLINRGRDEDTGFNRKPDGGIDPAMPALGKGYVTASSLNFRAEPRANADTIAPPLPRGTIVDVLDQKAGWHQVRVNGKIGWLKSEFLKTA
ncbi:MAG TPA: N-acetylmuramoyl-L-alanine amidase [Dongiaceae bacterium]|nr:N-acetylmuramoyl-L-alanine amidase [Dongiaceae bacterium]